MRRRDLARTACSWLLPLLLLDGALSSLLCANSPLKALAANRKCRPVIMTSDGAVPSVAAESLSESLVSLHDQKGDVRDRLSQDGILEAVPAAFNYSMSTAEYYSEPGAPHTGKYAFVRRSLDASFHTTYSVQRQALQDRLLDDALYCEEEACAPSSSPWIVFTAGAMGSGKSRTFEYL